MAETPTVDSFRDPLGHPLQDRHPTGQKTTYKDPCGSSVGTVFTTRNTVAEPVTLLTPGVRSLCVSGSRRGPPSPYP